MSAHPVSITPVNNDIYRTLGNRWYEASDDPVALLRAESRLRNPWVAAELARSFGARPCKVLDVGCGAGFLANSLAKEGHEVIGLDASAEALCVAAEHDSTRSVRYQQGNALQLPYPAGSFDAVCAMDFLEHVENPRQVIAEAARVLTPSGAFFFHTFNRNFLSWLIVIKGVSWFVRNTPRDLHILRLFLKPQEVRDVCAEHALGSLELRGVRPTLGLPFWRMLLTRRVSDDFSFAFTSSTLMGYSGVARRAGVST